MNLLDDQSTLLRLVRSLLFIIQDNSATLTALVFLGEVFWPHGVLSFAHCIIYIRSPLVVLNTLTIYLEVLQPRLKPRKVTFTIG